MNAKTRMTAMLAMVLGLGGIAIAGQDAALIKLKTDKVIIFKDGYTMFIRSGGATCNERGEVHIEDVPDSAVLGSFWATSENGPAVAMTAGYHVETNKIEETVACIRYIEILEANKGKTCTVTLNDKMSYTGKIRDVLTKKTGKTVQPGHLSAMSVGSSYRPSVLSASLSSSQLQGNHFVLATGDGDLLLPVNSIQTLRMQDMTTTTTDVVTQTIKKKRLVLRFDTPGVKKKVTLMYFRPGMRWIPTYYISLPEQKGGKANIRLQAEILNEAEDLIDTPVDIVVGVPNFRFRTIVSPLILETVLRDALRQAAPQIMGRGNQFSNAMFSQRSSEHFNRGPSRSGAAGSGSVNLPQELTAGGRHDLFIYHLPKMTLRTKERTAVHIFNAKTPCRDVYTWDVRIKRHDIATAPSGSGITSPLALSKNEVWHLVELENATKVPWTTGAAMIMQGQQPLAQELLTYTSPGDAVRVPVTVSVDTRGTATEKEIGRQTKALVWDRHSYAKISNQALLTLVNRKSASVDVEITLRFGGKVDEATDDANVVIAPYSGQDWERYRGSAAVNNSSIVRWTTTIKPGRNFKPSVKYHYFARH
ncbi:hypothetical protein ACFLQU_05855 [Verrucomicrobiota bacterium]